MAKLDIGILGGFSGRVGTVVGYHRHGAWFVRAYQPHIKDRKSAAQLEQRSRFKAMIQFASPATPVLRVGLRQVAADWQITEGNAFLKINHRNFQNNLNNQNFQNFQNNQNIQNNLNNQINYSGLQFSLGRLTAPKGLQYTVDEGGVLTVCWCAEGGSLTDRIHLYIYCPAAQTGIALEGERGRHGLQALLPQDFVGEELHLWAFASNARGEVSPTAYAATAENPSDTGSGCLSAVSDTPSETAGSEAHAVCTADSPHHRCAGSTAPRRGWCHAWPNSREP